MKKLIEKIIASIFIAILMLIGVVLLGGIVRILVELFIYGWTNL